MKFAAFPPCISFDEMELPGSDLIASNYRTHLYGTTVPNLPEKAAEIDVFNPLLGR